MSKIMNFLKTHKIIYLVLLVVLLYFTANFLAGCTEPYAKSVSISVSSTRVAVGEKVKVTVNVDYGESGSDYTAKIDGKSINIDSNSAKAKVDGNTLEITPQSAGFFTVYAHVSDSKWNGDTAYSLTSNKITVEVFGAGSLSNISTADEFLQISNVGSYKIVNDIDFTGKEINVFPEFKGVLDGGGYALKNMTVNSIREKGVGLFSSVSGVVQNLKLESFTLNAAGAGEAAGGITGFNFGDIKNCEVTGSINAGDYDYTGGIAGFSASSVSGCVNHAAVTGKNYTGGIVGVINPKDRACDFVALKNYGTVNGNDIVGGLVGGIANVYQYNHQNLDIIVGGVNEGAVTAKGNQAGGIAGYTTEASWSTPDTSGKNESNNSQTYKFFVKLDGCENKGAVKGLNNIGGIVGHSVQNSKEQGELKNSGDISGDYYIGGFYGYVTTTLLKNLTNTARITGKGYVGGIAGYAEKIEDCVNNGIIEFTHSTFGQKAYVGGIAGHVSGNVSNCENNADITLVDGTPACIGGIAGQISGTCTGNTNNGNISGAAQVGGISGSAGGGVNNINTGTVTGTAEVGGLFGTVSGSITGNANQGTVSGQSSVGGIAGKASGSEIKNNTNTASVTGSLDNVAGIVGSCAGSATIESNMQSGTVTGRDYTGGVIGYDTNAGNITANQAAGSVTGRNYVGGIVGYTANSTIKSIENICSVSGNAMVGGIAGYANKLESVSNNGTVNASGTMQFSGMEGTFLGGVAARAAMATDCKNKKPIAVPGGSYIAGVIAVLSGTSTSTKLENLSAVSGANIVAGVVAFYDGGSLTISSNFAAVTASGDVTAGIIAYLNKASSAGAIASCSNNGSAVITGNSYVGGIVGKRLSTVNTNVVNANCLNQGVLVSNITSTQSDLYGCV